MCGNRFREVGDKGQRSDPQHLSFELLKQPSD